jgi:uncharacterized protein YndB with AHSA1/START domain
MTGHFATLTFERSVQAPLATLWQAWIAPSARAIWSPPNPDVTVELLESDARIGGREISTCRAKGYPDIRVEAGWLDLQAMIRSVNYEVVMDEGTRQSAALVTAQFCGDESASQITLTVQLSAMSGDMEAGYREGFGAGLANLAEVSGRMMVLHRLVRAPARVVWDAWAPDALPKWWGPDGFSCRTARIDLRQGGDWVFDMIGPDGTVYPNHHRYGTVLPGVRIDYTLHAGENGPKHADAWVMFDDLGEETGVTLGMVFPSTEIRDHARGFGAETLGMQTLGKLARFVGSD